MATDWAPLYVPGAGSNVQALRVLAPEMNNSDQAAGLEDHPSRTPMAFTETFSATVIGPRYRIGVFPSIIGSCPFKVK